MISKSKVSRRNRQVLQPANVPLGTTVVATPGTAGGFLTLTLSAPMTLSGVPAITVQGITPTSAVMLSPLACKCVYATPPAAGNAYVIPPNDPALRSQNGGYLAAKAGTF